jgi:hypothetical protein
MLLQDRVGIVAEEQEPIDVARGLHLQGELDAEDRAVGGPPCGLVGEPHRAVQHEVDGQHPPLTGGPADEGADQEDGDSTSDAQAIPEDPVVAGPDDRVHTEARQRGTPQPGKIVDRNDCAERHTIVELRLVGHYGHGLPG